MFERNSRNLLTTVVLLLLVLVAVAPQASAKDGDWNFMAGLYGWLPTINGSISTEVPGLDGDITIDPSDLLENLSFTLMGTVVATRNDWGIFADAIYLKESKSTDQVIDVGEGVNLHTDFTLNSWILNFGGLYEVAKTPGGSTFNVLLGARYLSARATLHLKADGPLATDETVEAPADIWNGVLGANGRIALGKNWYIPVLLDAGTGDSDFTWQGMGGVGYEFKWGGLVLAYRYLEFDQETDHSYNNLNFGGGELGVFFRF